MLRSRGAGNFAAFAAIFAVLAATAGPLWAAGSVSGTVTKNGAALPGAVVNVIDSGNASKQATTAANGSYAISGVADGDAHVYCYSPNNKLIEHRIVTIAGATVTANFDWQVGNVGGTVKKNGSTLGGAHVKIVDVNNNWYEAVTAVNGTYSITGVTAGGVGAYCYDVDGTTQIGYKTWAVAKGITVTIDFDAWFFGSVQATISRGGLPYSGGTVETHDALGNWHQGTTNASGVCTITNVAAGPVDVYAYTQEGWPIGQQKVTMTQDATVPVTFVWGNGTVNVTVTRNGAPLQNAYVTAGAASGTTNSSGQCSLTVEAGHRTISVYHNIPGSVDHGYLIEARDVDFLTGGTVNETFTWHAGTVHGRITKYGAALPGATVGVVSRGFVMTDAGGNYTIDVSAGAQTLTFNSPAPSPVVMSTYDLPVAEGGSYLVDFDWRAPKTTVGGVISADTTWTPDNSPYLVTSDITVNAGVTLTVLPGTRIHFSPATGMTVLGRLDARGPTPDSIHFGSRQELFQPSTALPGDWKGIVLSGSGSNGSQMDFCAVVYAGDGPNAAAVYFASSSAQLTNSEVSYSSTRGVAADSLSGPVLASDSFVGNADVPITVIAGAVYQCVDDIGTGNLNGDVIEVRGGDVTSTCTWRLNGLSYRVVGDVTVRYGDRSGTPAILTIDPGCTLRFAPGVGIYTGWENYGWFWGQLVANGTAAKPITFAAVDAAAGHWRGLYLRQGTVSSGTILNYCVVQDAGSAGDASVYCASVSPAITNCTIRGSSAFGIYADDGSMPTIQSCVFQGNANFAISVYPTQAHEVAGNTGSGNLPADDIQIRAGDVMSVQTWHLNGMPYRVMGNLTVRYSDRSGTPAVLTIEPGCILKFVPGASLFIGLENYGWFYGKIVAVGAPGQPITFTSVDPGAGQWSGIVFRDGTVDDGCILSYCVIENGGTNITCQSASPAVTHSVIRNGSGYGLYADDPSNPVIQNNTFTGNANYPIGLYPDRVGFCQLTGNTGTGNMVNEIEVRAGNVRNNQTWPKDSMNYRVTGSVTVFSNDQNIANPAVLTINPGCTLSFADGTTLNIGYNSYGWYWGKLIAQGTAGQPIKFTSITKTAGAWQGIFFRDGSSDDSIMQYCVVENAGASRGASVYCESANTTIRNSTIRTGTGYGIYADDGAAPIVQANTITGQTGYPMSFYPDRLGFCQLAGNTGSGNMVDEIEVRGGNVRSSQTWPLDSMNYRVTGTVSVYGPDRASEAPAVLTIAPGCKLTFADDTGLCISYNSYGWFWAKLIAQGTEQAPITFTAVTKEPGKWRGLVFRGGTASGSAMERCVVEYAGSTETTGVNCQSCSPSITDCEIRASSGYGLYADDGAGPVLTRVSFENNVGFPVSFHWSHVASIKEVSGSGNQAGDQIQIRPPNITSDLELSPVGMPFRFMDDATISNNATLIVNHGVMIAFNGRLNVGHPSTSSVGTLRLLGTSDDPITLTAASGQAGDWGGVYVTPRAGALTELRHVIIAYGGGDPGTKANLYVSSTNARIVNCDVFRSSQNGIVLTAQTPVKNCIVTENANFGISGSGSWVTYTDTWANEGGNYSGAAVGAGCISANPRYVAPGSGDFHLQAQSPCIDAGDPSMTDLNGSRIDMGAWSVLGPAVPAQPIGSAKRLPDGTAVVIENKPIVGVYAGAFYMEDDDRSNGIRVASTDPVAVGDRVSVSGLIATLGGERYIPASQVKQMPVPAGSVVPEPVKMVTRTIGGGSSGAAPAMTGGSGLNTVGLLVKTFGWVTSAVSDGFYIDDGCLMQGEGANKGVKVITTGLLPGITFTPPEVGRFVTVTGCIGAWATDGAIRPLVRVRQQQDMVFEQAQVSLDNLEGGLGKWTAMPDSDMPAWVNTVSHSPTHSAFADQNSVSSMHRVPERLFTDRVYMAGYILDKGGSGAFGRAYIGLRAMDADTVKDYFSIGIWSLTSSGSYCIRTSSQGWMATSIARSKGWHDFAIAVMPYSGTNDVWFYIDGVLAGKGNRTVNWSINDIQVGPSNTPAGADAWYDDIEFGLTEWLF